MRVPNLTNSLILVGIAFLGMTMYVPTATADRAARVEDRAEEAGRALLETAVGMQPIDLGDAAGIDALESAFSAACKELGHPSSYLPRRVDKPESLASVECALFESKHYCFMLTRRPRHKTEDESVRCAFEAYAWPMTLQPPGHTAFFFPEEGDAAFSRNLMHQYVGWDENRRENREIPRPGAGIPRRTRTVRWYRGNDDERWIVLREIQK